MMRRATSATGRSVTGAQGRWGRLLLGTSGPEHASCGVSSSVPSLFWRLPPRAIAAGWTRPVSAARRAYGQQVRVDYHYGYEKQGKDADTAEEETPQFDFNKPKVKGAKLSGIQGRGKTARWYKQASVGLLGPPLRVAGNIEDVMSKMTGQMAEVKVIVKMSLQGPFFLVHRLQRGSRRVDAIA